VKPFQCACSNTLYFDNTRCLQCDAAVGYDLVTDAMHAYTVHPGHRLCANGTDHGVCNWLVPEHSPDKLCLSCQCNRMIPDLTIPENRASWAKLESAKRRAIYTLLQVGLRFEPSSRNPEIGLTFDFLLPEPGKPVITGHENGTITMNVEEADDVIREFNRQSLREPYRTLLGHFRHELGHYFWWLWFGLDPNPEELAAVREVFGDETQDYQAAAEQHYRVGPPAGWESQHLSAYCTMHPWEDWAETWAHYLHIADGLETAKFFGIDIGVRLNPAKVFQEKDMALPGIFAKTDATRFVTLLDRWAALTPAMNEMSVSLGRRDLYPFVVTPAAARKMYLIHCLVQSRAQSGVQSPVTSAATRILQTVKQS